MAAIALIKLTQASGPTDVAGRAVEGTLTGVPASDKVTVTNNDNTDVNNWDIELLYDPPGSALGAVPGTPVMLGTAVSSTPSATFIPDVAGSYRIRLTVRDSAGTPNIDIRDFGIENENGIIVPPYQKLPDSLPVLGSGTAGEKPNEQNYGGQAYGWAGDRSSKLYETHLKTYRDARILDVSTTPFTAIAEEATHYRVLTSTIGGASTFNLPTGARVGQSITVFDGESAADLNTIGVVAVGGDAFLDGTTQVSISNKNGQVTVRKVAASTWMVEYLNQLFDVTPVFSGVGSVDQISYVRIGSFPYSGLLDGADTTYQLTYILETTDAVTPIYAEARIYNVTDSVAVANTETLATVSSLIPVKVIKNPTFADWNAGAGKVYELQIKMSTTGVPADRITCTYCEVLRINSK